MRDFRNLLVWQHAYRFTVGVFQVTRGFPVEQRYVLTAQLRRAALSIGANIAEACGYRGQADSGRFYQIAMGSACESQHHMLVALGVGLLTQEKYDELEQDLRPVRGMLVNILKRIRKA